MYNPEEMIARIKYEKGKSDLTNEELAERSGVPIGTLSKILSGETKDPRISNIIKISKVLNVSADYIIFGEEITKTPPPLSAEEQKLLSSFKKLNATGKYEAAKRVGELAEISKYAFGETNIKIAARTGHTIETVRDDIDDLPDVPDTI